MENLVKGLANVVKKYGPYFESSGYSIGSSIGKGLWKGFKESVRDVPYIGKAVSKSMEGWEKLGYFTIGNAEDQMKIFQQKKDIQDAEEALNDALRAKLGMAPLPGVAGDLIGPRQNDALLRQYRAQRDAGMLQQTLNQIEMNTRKTKKGPLE